jgi:hypothetical protein
MEELVKNPHWGHVIVTNENGKIMMDKAVDLLSVICHVQGEPEHLVEAVQFGDTPRNVYALVLTTLQEMEKNNPVLKTLRPKGENPMSQLADMIAQSLAQLASDQDPDDDDDEYGDDCGHNRCEHCPDYLECESDNKIFRTTN